jgi:alpha-amylase
MKHIANLKYLALLVFILFQCNPPSEGEKKEADKKVEAKTPFFWEAANIYFLMTDRFNNGDKSNDVNFDRTKATGKLRGFMGGDIKGISAKIKDNYFKDLGINAIWFTPVFEQIHGSVDESTGNTYGFHGYWIRDWTNLDPNFGTLADLKEMVQLAHSQGIRVILDVVINHTGPVTEKDPVFPANWVKTTPKCTYKDYNTTINCTLVDNLPDVKTESNEAVELPKDLLEKWKKEGRDKQELAELEEFFKRTNLPKTPKNYIIKWLTDYVKELGIDGFRVDTAKHIEESIGKTLYQEAAYSFDLWKKNNPEAVLDETPFYMVGEVYGYNANNKRIYDFGDKKVDFFSNGYTALINFGFIYDAVKDYQSLFQRYDSLLRSPEMKDAFVLNYLSSHDDGNPFDKKREKAIESANKLLLAPGAAQVYYGDETSRPLEMEGVVGDANLRVFMNWEELSTNSERGGAKIQDILKHWQRLGRFRQAHPAIGAGNHQMLSAKPYLFTRSFKKESYEDKVLVGLDLEKGKKEIDLKGFFKDVTTLRDAYSGQEISIKDGKASFESDFTVVLLEVKK